METNNFKTLYPQIASEWHPALNGTDIPENYSYGSHKKVWWIGKCGHEWKASIKARVAYNTGCPYCSGNKVLKGFNDLASVYPKLAKEWNSELNGSLCPDEVTSGSNKKVFWLCERGHFWEAAISSRVSGKGCRYCAGQDVWVGYNDLQSVDPQLASEWHPNKNKKLTPQDVTYGSRKKVWWLGNCGHEWQETIKVRKGGIGCPFCAGKRALKGFNDIASLFPYLKDEWDYEKNMPNIPEMYTRGSNKKVSWICPVGHHYDMQVVSRTSGQNCPVCASELKTSFPEQAFFFYVKKVFPEAINRDYSYGFELDIYIPSLNVAIEYDGVNWHQNEEKEHVKNVKCISKGIRIIRIKEQSKFKEDKDVTYVYRKDYYSSQSLNEVINETLCILNADNDLSVDVNRDRQSIYAQFVSSIKKNNLAVMFPELAKEWNYKKNINTLPEQFTQYSNKKVWWIGKCGHEWEAIIEARAYGQGCPICNGKKICIGENDLETNYPELVSEWNWEKNTLLNPSQVTPHSQKKVWWLGKCGHEWESKIADRVYGRGCPVCGGKKVQQGYNDLLTKDSFLAKQWDYEKNKGMFPENVTLFSSKKAWWKCDKGHSYETRIAQKAKMGLNCPVCSNRLIVSGVNDLVTECPFVVAEWDYEKNKGINPESVGKGSGKKVYWQCLLCDNSFQREIREHVKDSAKCPRCKAKLIDKRFNNEIGE